MPWGGGAKLFQSKDCISCWTIVTKQVLTIYLIWFDKCICWPIICYLLFKYLSFNLIWVVNNLIPCYFNHLECAGEHGAAKLEHQACRCHQEASSCHKPAELDHGFIWRRLKNLRRLIHENSKVFVFGNGWTITELTFLFVVFNSNKKNVKLNVYYVFWSSSRWKKRIVDFVFLLYKRNIVYYLANRLHQM